MEKRIINIKKRKLWQVKEFVLTMLLVIINVGVDMYFRAVWGNRSQNIALVIRLIFFTCMILCIGWNVNATKKCNDLIKNGIVLFAKIDPSLILYDGNQIVIYCLFDYKNTSYRVHEKCSVRYTRELETRNKLKDNPNIPVIIDPNNPQRYMIPLEEFIHFDDNSYWKAKDEMDVIRKIEIKDGI